MSKAVFTHASPKAAEGIRRLSQRSGAEARVFLNPTTSDATVVVSRPDRVKLASDSLLQSKSRKR